MMQRIYKKTRDALYYQTHKEKRNVYNKQYSITNKEDLSEKTNNTEN